MSYPRYTDPGQPYYPPPTSQPQPQPAYPYQGYQNHNQNQNQNQPYPSAPIELGHQQAPHVSPQPYTPNLNPGQYPQVSVGSPYTIQQGVPREYTANSGYPYQQQQQSQQAGTSYPYYPPSNESIEQQYAQHPTGIGSAQQYQAHSVSRSPYAAVSPAPPDTYAQPVAPPLTSIPAAATIQHQAAYSKLDPSLLYRPSASPVPPSTTAQPSTKVTLRIPRAPQSTSSVPDLNMPTRHNPRAPAPAPPAAAMTSRPQRGASQRAAQRQQLQLQAEDDDEDDYDGVNDNDGDGDEDHLVPEHLAPVSVPIPTRAVKLEDEDGPRRSSRDRKPVHHYADDDFEAKALDLSPTRIGTKPGGRGKPKRVIDPDSEEEEEDADGDEEDGDGDGEYVGGGGGTKSGRRNAFPPRQTTTRASLSGIHGSAAATAAGVAGPSYTPHTNGRSTRSKPLPASQTKSRNSSADAESFQPDQSGSEGEQSEDVLARDYSEPEGEDSEDDSESRTSSPRRRSSRRMTTRSNGRSGGTSKPAGRAGGGAVLRRSARNRHGSSDEDDDDYGGGGKNKRTLRARVPVNYQLPPADISTEIRQAELLEGIAAASRPNGAVRARFAGGPAGLTGVTAGVGAGGGGGGGGLGTAGVAGGRGRGVKRLPWSLGGKDLARAMRDPDTSDSDDLMTPMPSSAAAGAQAAAAAGNQGILGGSKVTAPTDIKDFGRINPKSSMADADPLGVDMNVTFDNVGGLDGHIDQLKEMVALPLLYPEVFQQFGITPPRGVLFHGPPGTGKTLLARALAASCSNGNTKIGADVLSKWVGEAERQLRMLFDEARAAQPSIIFFDEIDGLAPVRSSKQDQIHASLVSTLLALMDGMDGRGQVIVIGATNRPDSVDPALRRPGRFDREFYFPLPNKDARKKIIQINTRMWTPALGEGMVEMLAGMTKGYGGADMRALCTEAALNAIQRRYPQIYRSTDRFELDTSSIQVKPKDFLMSIKKIVPSSARSTASTAIPLPAHLVPLLSTPLDRLKAAVDAALPRHKTRTALEEAMFEDDEGDVAGAEILQTLDKMRTYRPRVLVSGESGMGQTYLGPAILHHLEGFHVQSFDLGVLLSDSTRTVEAALVQLFIEAKRHQPSIIYIPALVAWSNTLSDSAKATLKSLLDGILPSEPVLLLGVAEAEEVSMDVRGWFGWGEEDEVELLPPTEAERAEYFTPLTTHIQTPPNMWPDALPRRPRNLEQLPLAAPLPPRKPTEAELARERERDVNARNMMVLSFTGLVSEFGRKYKRVVASVKEDAFLLHSALVQQAAEVAEEAVPIAEAFPPVIQGAPLPNGTTSLPVIQHTFAGNGELTSHSQPTLSAPTASPGGPAVDATGQGPADLPYTQSTGTSGYLAHMGELSAGPISHIPIQVGPADSSTFESSLETNGPIPVATATAAAAPAPSGPDWTPYDIDTDILSRKLSKHKYHRPLDFLSDVDKIKANAEHLMDVDRQNKIAELVSHAYLHVAEFDPRWGPEFEAYAERMRMRKEERGKGRERVERERKEKEARASPDPIAMSSPPVPGLAEPGEVASENMKNVEEGEERQKRQRDEGDVEMGDEDGEGREKRARTGEYTALAEVSSISKNATASVPSVPPPSSAAAAPEDIPAPTPAPVYPPFIVPTAHLYELRVALQSETNGFSIEQLEQLRAGMFDRIWRQRAEWDRTGLIDDLKVFLGKMTTRLQKSRS